MLCYVMGKPVPESNTSLDLNEARDDGVSGCSGISWTICKQSTPRSREVSTPTPHHSVFTGSVKALKAFPCTTHIFTISADKWILCLKDNGAQHHNWQRSSSSFLWPMSLHRESKKQDTKLSPITSPNVNRFSKNSFANELKDFC